MERFSKERDSTILADAAIRGLVPRAKAARIQVIAHNKGALNVQLEHGRVLLDDKGNIYRLETPATVGSTLSASLVLSQISMKTIMHTVQESLPFYPIEIPASNDGAYLSSISVSIGGVEYKWVNNYTNVYPGDMSFHVEVDDQRRVYVRFGMQDIVGVQPEVGEQITLTLGYSMGDVVPQVQSNFALDYTNSAEANLEITYDRLIQRGENPITMDVLRDIARYPSVYADDAVFLGEFDALIRKNFQSLQFCCIWNETAEELARGASVENINRLFVAVQGIDGEEPVLVQSNDVVLQPQRITDDLLTSLQKEIRQKILLADDSYRISFYTPVVCEISIQVIGRIASSYSRQEVINQIRKVLLDAYGKSSQSARRGYNMPLYQNVYEILRKRIQAFSGGAADFQINIGAQHSPARPELWSYVSENSLSVEIESINTVLPGWG